jgi:glutamyl-tRNA reductase
MAKKSVWSVIKYQRAKVPPVTTANLAGQTVVVVGANTGIGFEAAKHFAQMNPGKLILACRNEEKGKAAVASEYAPMIMRVSVDYLGEHYLINCCPRNPGSNGFQRS